LRQPTDGTFVIEPDVVELASPTGLETVDPTALAR
jgi:hypothetical protein